MTPQEIAEYKQRWMNSGNNYPIKIDSDLDIEGKYWCRKNLERHQWSFGKYTDHYEHTFYFEDQLMSQQFAQEFYDWVQR